MKTEQLPDIEPHDQKALLQQYIQESVTYFILCDECHGCTDDLTGSTLGFHLYERGFRLREDESGRELVICPKCAGTEQS